MSIVAYQSEREKGLVRVTSTSGLDVSSDDASVLLRAIAADGGNIGVVWDSADFWKPLLTLMPKDKSSLLVDGKAVYIDGIRLWWGITRHGRNTGIRYKEYKLLKNNVYDSISHEIEINELKQYYGNNDKPVTLLDIKSHGEQIISRLGAMGIKPSNIASAIGIYKDNILDRLPIATIHTMDEDTWDCHELAYNTIDEWVSIYKSSDDRLVYSYDLTAAYASALAELPNLDSAEIVYSDDMPDPGWDWGVFNCIIHNKKLVSPLIKPDIGRCAIGWWEGVMTSDLFYSLYQWDIAEIEPKGGYYIYLNKYYKPLNYSMRKLYSYRNGDTVQNDLAKSMAVGTWGKMLEVRETQQGIEYGEYFNPIYGSMVVNNIKTKVTDFIYKNKLQNELVSVNVDGVKTTKYLDISLARSFGDWRRVSG